METYLLVVVSNTGSIYLYHSDTLQGIKKKQGKCEYCNNDIFKITTHEDGYTTSEQL